MFTTKDTFEFCNDLRRHLPPYTHIHCTFMCGTMHCVLYPIYIHMLDTDIDIHPVLKKIHLIKFNHKFFAEKIKIAIRLGIMLS